METCCGKGVGEGIAIGKICVYQEAEQAVICKCVEDTEAECHRVIEAKEAVIKDLQDLYERTKEAAGEEAAAIFDVHQMMLEDGNYQAYVERIICERWVNAEYAVEATGAYYAELFAGMEDEYIKSRSADILDVSKQLIAKLSGCKEGGCVKRGCREDYDESVIIVAEDLSPSQTVSLGRGNVLALVTRKGSVTSHVSILAKTMGIPAIVGIDRTLDGLDGLIGAVDGRRGLLIVGPDEATIEELNLQKMQEEREKKTWEQFRGKKTFSVDGRPLLLCANVGNLSDLESALLNDAEGIGLFRTELLYLERDDYPTEEEQFVIYKQAMETMEGKPVVIRTLDIGADKQCAYMNLPKEQNPALGCRGIRVCLARPELLKTQLRALFRAARFGDLKIMYPMITSPDEIRQVKVLVQEVQKELAGEGREFRVPKQGIMIETPAAAIISDMLAGEADFFSIGTNDLTQYTLAMDRENGELSGSYDGHHPAVLRLIAMTVENAHKAGIPAGICGELAGDESLLNEWLKIGVDELSVTPGNVLFLRGQIAGLKML